MESILWALNLIAVTWLCWWALKAEKRKEKEQQAAARERRDA